MAEEQPTDERWRDVVGFEGSYRISDHGRLWGIKRQHYLSPWHSGSGHLQTGLWSNGKRHFLKIHRLVLEAFVGPCPEGMEGCHADDDVDNNHLSNLRWATRSENMYDRVRNGRHSTREKTHCVAGHERTPENLYTYPSSYRKCRICASEQDRARRAKKKAAA